jgi:hypothetical protein
MNELQLAKIQNTINEIQNQLTKIYIDTPVFRVLMQRSIIQLNELMTHVGYLETKLELNNVDKTEATCIIDENWELKLSHGPQAEYLINGEAIQMLVDHINYMHVLIENCPGNKDVK